jgi:hypothetical protein
MMKADREIKEALESWGTAAMADCWSVDSRRSISVPQALAWRVASTRMTGRTAPDASSPCAATTGGRPCPACHLRAQQLLVGASRTCMEKLAREC